MDDNSGEAAKLLEESRRLRRQALKTRERLGELVQAHLRARTNTVRVLRQVADVLHRSEQVPPVERSPDAGADPGA